MEIKNAPVQSSSFKDDTLMQIITLKNAFINAFLQMFSIHIENLSMTKKPNMLQQKLKEQFASPLAAFSYLVFILLYIPCVSTMAAIKEVA